MTCTLPTVLTCTLPTVLTCTYQVRQHHVLQSGCTHCRRKNLTTDEQIAIPVYIRDFKQIKSWINEVCLRAKGTNTSWSRGKLEKVKVSELIVQELSMMNFLCTNRNAVDFYCDSPLRSGKLVVGIDHTGANRLA